VLADVHDEWQAAGDRRYPSEGDNQALPRARYSLGRRARLRRFTPRITSKPTTQWGRRPTVAASLAEWRTHPRGRRLPVHLPGYRINVRRRELVSVRFQPGRSAGAPRLARRALGEWLDTVPCSDTVARDAQLVVTELTTNTIVHTRSAPTIVASFDESRLRIEVHDQDRAPPRTCDQPGASGGWGLRLVAAVTDGWGWNPTPSGKQVWTEMLC